MDNKIEYIDKSILTDEQKNEIAETVDNFIKENKKTTLTKSLDKNYLFLQYSILEFILELTKFIGSTLDNFQT